MMVMRLYDCSACIFPGVGFCLGNSRAISPAANGKASKDKKEGIFLAPPGTVRHRYLTELCTEVSRVS